jgi:replicative DNA helicase
MSASGPDPLAAPDSTDLLERALLGSLMLAGPSAVARVTRMLPPAAFVREKHRYVYEAILGVARDVPSGDPDLVLVVAELDSRGKLDAVGGAAYVTGLVDGLPCVDNVVSYAKRVKERSVLVAALKQKRIARDE